MAAERRPFEPRWQPSLESKEIVSQLLTNTNLIFALYLCIKNAAVYATTNSHVLNDSQKTCAYPIGALASSRESKKCYVIDQYRVEYHPDDILIVGGVAIALYDAYISGIKQHRYQNTSTLQGYVQKNTTDIDMVWWPRITPPMKEHVVTINSQAISTLVAIYISTLQRLFTIDSVIQNIQDVIHKIRPDITLVNIEVKESSRGIKAGVKKVLIYFNIILTSNHQITLEVCDISIHDSASSQIHVEAGNFALKPMTDDPIYCIPRTQTTAFPLGSEKIYVPNILSILRQQQFAFKRLLEVGENKCLINYKRILYLQQMIFEYDYQKKNENFKKIFDMPVNITEFIKNLNRNLRKTIKDACPRNNANNVKNSSQICTILYDLQATHESELITMQKTHHSKQEQKLHEQQRKNEYNEQQRKYEYDPQQEQQMYELYQLLQQQNKPQGGFIKKKQTKRKNPRRKNKTHKR